MSSTSRSLRRADAGRDLCDGFVTRREDTKSACGGRQDEIGILERGEADKHDAVVEIVEELGGDLYGEPRLARPAGAGQRDEPDLRPPEQVHHLPDLTLASDEGRRAGGGKLARAAATAARRQNGTRYCELRIMIQDLALEALQLLARLDPELVDECAPRRLIDLERLGLTPGSVEREHELAAQPLLKRMLRDKGSELGGQGAVTAELEVRLDPLDQRRKP